MNQENQLILDDERGIKVDEKLVEILKPHQKEGVAFMWKALFQEMNGCILAHSMGLGKTLQVVTIIHTFMTKNPTAKVLIVCPIIVINNWEDELNKWTEMCSQNSDIPVEKIQSYLSKRDIDAIIRNWRKERVGGVFIIGYEKFCNLMKDDESTFDGCNLLICDEGHTLKNPESVRNKMANKVRTPSRIILSGTPLQNNLNEYYDMMKFVKNDIWYTLFDVETEESALNLYSSTFIVPMKKGQYIDSSEEQFTKMLYRSFILHDLLKPYIHRRNGLHITGMPKKDECVLYVCLTDIQKRLYEKFLGVVDSERSQQKKYNKLFRDKNIFNLICNHPKALNNTDDIDGTENELIPSVSGPVVTTFGQWWRDHCTNDELKRMETSNKMRLLFSILEECESSDEKVLVFSHSLATLDTIEYFLEERDKLPNRYYFRMDGKTQKDKRNDDIKSFNRNRTSRLYLMSIGAGGVGINLIAASRVIIFDLSWNPSKEVQSIYRAYRIGQKKPCKIYRFVAAGTMEEKIYKLQIEKMDLAERVVDHQNVDGHFKENDLKDLYDDFKYVPPRDFPDELVRKQFFAKQLRLNIVHDFKDCDRLLNNNLDDIFTIEDKEVAYDDYNNYIRNAKQLLLRGD